MCEGKKLPPFEGWSGGREGRGCNFFFERRAPRLKGP